MRYGGLLDRRINNRFAAASRFISARNDGDDFVAIWKQLSQCRVLDQSLQRRHGKLGCSHVNDTQHKTIPHLYGPSGRPPILTKGADSPARSPSSSPVWSPPRRSSRSAIKHNISYISINRLLSNYGQSNSAILHAIDLGEEPHIHT